VCVYAFALTHLHIHTSLRFTHIHTHAQGGMQYRIIQAMTTSMVFYVIASALDLIHLAVYSADGIGSPFLHAMRFFYDAFGTLIQLAMILTIARGSYISTARLVNFRSTACICVVYFVMMSVVKLWSIAVTDRAEVLYIYDSPPGWLLVTMRYFTMFYFWYLIRKTVMAEKDELRRMFYVGFMCFGTLWILAMPLTTHIAVGVNSWEREKAVFAIEQSFNLLLSIGLWYLFRPCGNKYVPGECMRVYACRCVCCNPFLYIYIYLCLCPTYE
jgi:hypothetical protein